LTWHKECGKILQLKKEGGNMKTEQPLIPTRVKIFFVGSLILGNIIFLVLGWKTSVTNYHWYISIVSAVYALHWALLFATSSVPNQVKSDLFVIYSAIVVSFGDVVFIQNLWQGFSKAFLMCIVSVLLTVVVAWLVVLVVGLLLQIPEFFKSSKTMT
jgi:hypothetical protein